MHWHAEMQEDPLLKNIALLFDIDQPRSIYQLPNAACAKMNLNGNCLNPAVAYLLKYFGMEHGDVILIVIISEINFLNNFSTHFLVGPKKVIVRSCQTAKMPTLDPCQAIRRKLSTSSFENVPGRVVSMDECNLCQSDGCNGANGIAPPKIIALLFGYLGLMLFQAFRHRFA